MAWVFLLNFLVLAVGLTSAGAFMPGFYNGRPSHGFVKPPDLHLLSWEERMDMLKNPPKEGWIEQKLDHFNPADTRTWKQKYLKSGPASSHTLFVMIGGEGAASQGWMNSGQWVEYAKTYNAVRLQLEHRYYGDSHPTEDLSVENIQYLSSRQALSDTASFITAMKREFGASKVIVVGGSYSGALAAWFRLKYPHLADGALATSAPLYAELNFKGYLEVVSEALNTFHPVNSCNNAISTATAAMNEKIKTEAGRKELKEVLNLCEDIDMSKTKDIPLLFGGLAANFMQVVQYNNLSSTSPNIPKVCSIMTDDSVGDELHRYSKVNEILNKGACLGFDYDSMINYIKNETWRDDSWRQWMYQTCTEFGYYIGSDSDKQPFGHEFSAESIAERCADVYGPQFSIPFINGATHATNVYYGARNYLEDRVVFVNGNIDPWHYEGVTHDLPKATVIFIKGTAHCADMYTERPGDPPGLIQARKDVGKLIEKWLK